MKKIKSLFAFIFILSFAFILTSCDSDDSGTGPDDNSLNPPSNVKVKLNAVAGGSSIAQITWTSSTSEGNNNFKGYAVVTDSTDINGVRKGLVDSTFLDKSESDFKNISSIERGKFYKTKIYSISVDNKKSSSVETIVYAGVYSNTGTIDEYSPAYGSAQSGFARDVLCFGGTKLPFTSANFNKIDLHLRAVSEKLNFVSPKSIDGSARQTLYEEVPGTGQTAYDLSEELPEPTKTQIEVQADKVYLLKTQDNYYLKIWVKSINTGNYKTVNFEFKAQPINGFRVLKR